MSVLGIDHVQVAAPAGCEAAARAFYGDLLGMVELPKPAPLRARGGCWFAAGDQQLHVGVSEPFAPALKAHPCLLVSDLAALRLRLVAAGVDCSREQGVPDVERVMLADPFGNRLELRGRGR